MGQMRSHTTTNLGGIEVTKVVDVERDAAVSTATARCLLVLIPGLVL